MKVVVNQRNLQAGLAVVGRSVSTRSTLPVLAMIRLKAYGGGLELQATNLERAVYAEVACHVEEDGGICVPAKPFGEFVANLPDKPLTLELDKKRMSLKVSSGANQATFKGVNSDEFPMTSLPPTSNDAVLSIDGKTLVTALERTVFAASNQDSRPTLCGVNFVVEDGTVTLAATDGFRLSEVELTCDTLMNCRMIVPSESLREVIRLAKGVDKVTLHNQYGKAVIFEFGGGYVAMQTQLIDGNFPDYHPIIPQRHNTEAQIVTADFERACRQVAVFANALTGKFEIVCEDGITDGYVGVSAVNQETGDGYSQFPSVVTGDNAAFSCNIKFVQEVLAVAGDAVVLRCTKATEPIVIQSVEPGFKHVIMPMHFGS